MARPHLPSIVALQSFEAAALRLSFSQAAADLNVTPAAISQQIRALEGQLGVKLFARTGRGVRLTDVGKAWLPEVRRSLDRLARTVAAAREHATNVLGITVAPSFASRWLMGRLFRFGERHPEISVRVIATPEVVDLYEHDVDLAIRFGPGDYPGLTVERLMPEFLVPMCAPGLMTPDWPARHPSDLARYTLIHDDSVGAADGGWPLWLRAAKAGRVDALRGPRYSLAEIAMQEAIEGRGVVLARWQIAAADLRAGKLVCPFDLAIECPYAYFLVTRPESAGVAKVAAFRDWLFREVDPVEPPKVTVVRP